MTEGNQTPAIELEPDDELVIELVGEPDDQSQVKNHDIPLQDQLTDFQLVRDIRRRTIIPNTRYISFSKLIFTALVASRDV